MIDIVLNNRTKSRAFERAFFVRVIEASESFLSIPEGHTAEVGVTLIDADAMRILNKERRGVDASTDVLSFPLHMEPIKGYTSVLLGDLFICPEVVRARATEEGRSQPARMAWTIVHGMLHLAGYDHEGSTNEANRMFETERTILSALNL